MAFIETTYTALTGPQGMYRFLVDMVAQGWAVVISSDGITYNGSGNQIISNGSGAGGINNEHAYFVLRRTGAPDWLVQRASTADIWRILFSPSGAYTGGNATTRPTAGDEASAWDEFSTLFPSTTFNVEIHVEDTSPYRWALHTDDFVYVASVGSTTRPIALVNSGLAGGVFYSTTFTDPGAWEDVEAMLAATAGGGGPGDTIDPVISAFTPASGSSIARADAVEVDVTDETALGPVIISAEFADGTVLTVYEGGAFVGPFAASSTQVGDTWTIDHDAPGWPSSTVDIHVLAVDAAGNTATSTASFTITDPPVSDETPPVVTVLSPTPPGPVGRNDAVRLRVTDSISLKRAWLFVTMDGEQYVVHNGYSFRPKYAAGSTRTPVEGGYEFVVLRTGGWLAAPSFEVQAVDEAGNER